MKRTLALVMLAGCGGAAPMITPPPVVRTCEARWLTLDRDVIDLTQTSEGLMWLEAARGGIVHTPWYGTEQQLRPSAGSEQDARSLAVVPSGIVWARGDGGLFRLSGAPISVTQLGTVDAPAQLVAAGTDVIVASAEGIDRYYSNGSRQRLLDEAAHVITLDERSVYALTDRRILRVPLDGTLSETLLDKAPAVTSMVMHGGKLLVAAPGGVFAVADGKLTPYAPLDAPYVWNLRSAGSHVYVTAGNVVYVVRDRAAVPIAIAHDQIGDLEVDGPTLYVASQAYTGVEAICHDPDGAAVELATPALTCAEGETELDRTATSLDCRAADGTRTYAIALHTSGATAWEHGRDGVIRTWFADGTLRSEGDARYRADGTPIEDIDHDR